MKLPIPANIKYIWFHTTGASLASGYDYAIVKNTSTGEVKTLTATTSNNDYYFDISDYDELYFNFYGGDFLKTYTLYADTFSQEMLIKVGTIPTDDKAYYVNGNEIGVLAMNNVFNTPIPLQLHDKNIHLEFEIIGTESLGTHAVVYTDTTGKAKFYPSQNVGKYSIDIDHVDTLYLNLSQNLDNANGRFPSQYKLSFRPDSINSKNNPYHLRL